ncbi:MAG: hypothetical protein FJW23_10375 [Acidimicrobiia bacterium]|nr:hypothetical protein [Acidimicrobiia bacterium]
MVMRILNIVGWIGVALVFAAVVLRFVRPELDQYAVYLAWAGLASVVLYTLGQWRAILDAFKRRQARYGALASASVLIVLGLLVAVNYLASRQNKRWDLTANQQFSLSDQTTNLLQGLEEPLRLLVFDRGSDLDRYRTRLAEYEYQSSQVEVEYIDADKMPVQARQYNVESYGTIVLEYQGRQERAISDSEQDLGNALVKVITGEQKKVYFLQGHGEKDRDAGDRAGLTSVALALERENFEVAELVLAQVDEVPADASVLVDAGPTTDLAEFEVDVLRRYLNRGGHLLVLLDPPDQAGASMPVYEGFLREWGVSVGNDVVVDISGMGRLFGADDPSMPVAATYPPHPLTERFRLLTAFPLARSISAIPDSAERAARPLIETSERSWAESNVAQLLESGEVAMDPESGDRPGPITIGVAVALPSPDAVKAEEAAAAESEDGVEPEPADESDRKPETRVAVIGDSDFASNAYLGIQGNRDLFMNAVNWLAQQENLISIRPREASDRRITLTAAEQQSIFWFTLLGVPAAVLGLGVYTWSRRRR